MSRHVLPRARGLPLGAVLMAAVGTTAFATSPQRMAPAAAALVPASDAPATAAADPPLPTATAVLVKAFDCSSKGVVWSKLNTDWSQFGDVRVRIDYDNRALCSGSEITYEDLAASGAQTVILSDPSGAGKLFDPGEIAAITRYLQEGHDLIGTFLTLQSPARGGIDNRGLAPLFGLDPTATYGWRDVGTGSYTIRPRAPLFDGLGGQYAPDGYPGSQQPPGGRWTNAAAGNARILAYTRDRKAAILQYCGDGFRSFLFTQLPEYGDSNAQDERVLYNAIVMGRKPGCRHE